MSSELLLGLRLDPYAVSMMTITMSDVNFKTKVEDLKQETALRVNLAKDMFELIYCGSILEDGQTLEYYGLKSGSMVHVLRKREREILSYPRFIPEDSILQLASAFKSFKENPELRSALNGLGKKPEVMDNIISSSPGLHEDAVAIAVLQDPELMACFTDVDTVRRFAKAHPVLVEAAQNIAAAVHAEVHKNSTSGSNSVSNPQVPSCLYGDNLSDDEEMAGDSSQSSDSAVPANQSSNPSATQPSFYPIITPSQLALSVNRARARSQRAQSPPSTSIINNPSIITTEMFTRAMQQVHAPAITPRAIELRRLLGQMHEIGLRNDTLNLRALYLTNCDVQAAIDLVFNGFGSN